MAGRILGIARIKADGELLESLEGAELTLGGEVPNEEKVGHRYYGTTYKTEPGRVKCTIVWKNETPIEMLRTFFDGVVLWEGDQGITYKISNATIKGSLVAKDGSGEVDVEFVGNPAVLQ